MTIKGIGIDIINTLRLDRLLHKKADKFLNRIYSKQEIIIFHSIKNECSRINYLAKRFAAKEAFAKAMGCGIGACVSYSEVSVLNNQNGAPVIALHGKTLQYFNSRYPGASLYLSLSDTHEHAVATVAIA